MKKEELSDALNELDEEIIDSAAEKRVKPAVTSDTEAPVTPAPAPVPEQQLQAMPAPAQEQPPQVMPAPAAPQPEAPVKRKKPIFAWFGGIAAAAAAVVAGVVLIPKLTDSPVVIDGPAQTTPPFVTTTAESTTAAVPGSVFVSDGEPDDAGIYYKGLADRERPGSSIVADVSALTSADGFIMTDTSFKIDVNGDVTEDMLRSHLTVGGSSEYTLRRGNDGSFVLSASKDFARGDTVKVTVSDDRGEICDSYAFVTMDEFKVKTTYPYDGSTYTERSAGVEIEFTCAPDISDAASYFSISPSIDGEFLAAKNRLVFCHEAPFEPMTEYTVTLKAGFRSADGQTLAEDKTFTFTTVAHDNDTYFYTIGSNTGFSESFLPGDQAFIQICCSDYLRNTDHQLHLYRFDTADAYYEAIRARMNGSRSIDTSGLSEVYTSNEHPYSREDDNTVYVLLPEDLAEGCYIADISVDYRGEVYSLQYMVEVTPVSVYSLSLGEENLFYVNDSSTGAPASGAEITLEIDGKTYSAKVGSDGLAKVDTKGETGKAVLNVAYGSKRFMDALILSNAENVVYDDLYYTYIFTDRELYLTTDTVKVWGVLIPKAHSTALPTDLKITLGDMYIGTTEEEIPVTVSKNGTFTAEFSYKNHKSDYLTLSLMTGEDRIVSKGIGIQDYVKPEYIVDMTVPAYAALPQIDPIEVELDATYYEGTPAEGLVFEINNGGTNTEYVTTDAEGKASAEITLNDYGYNDWRLSYGYVSAELTGIENTYIYNYKGIDAFYRDVMLQYKLNENNDLTIYTNKIDFSKLDEYFEKRNSSEYADKSAYSILKGNPYNTEVSVVVKHCWTEQEEVGSYYDYLEKKTVKLYRYTDQSTRVAAYKVNTENGRYTLRALPFLADHGRYVIELSYNDAHGNPVELSVTVVMGKSGKWSEGDYYGYSGRNSGKLYYTIDMETETRKNDNAGYHKFSENEEVKFSLRCSESDVPVDGKLLLAFYQSDFIDYKIYDLSEASDILYTAAKDLIPDAWFEGAYFDGRHIYKADGGTMYYDPAERGLNIEASSDKDKYDAGETAKITVKVTDKDGKSVSGATVQLSCVDEAAFAMDNQHADILDGVYGYVWYPSAVSRTSYIQHESDNGFAGEKGGGGPSGTRREFKDTAYFGEAVTDATGTAVFTVKLPDNLTTWRATLLSLYDTSDDKLLAGTKLLPVVVSRNMIITPIMQSTYTEGDDISVSAKCAGLPSGEKITVKLYGAGADKEMNINAKQTANFGKLPAGEYTVTFITSGDAVEQKIKVVSTQLETDIVRGADLADITSAISPTKYPVTIAFFDKEYMFSTQILQELACYPGKNLGMRLAAAYAAVQFGYMTEQELIDEFMPETSSSLARELPNSDVSIELTALMCAAVPEAVNRDYLIPVLRSDTECLLSDMIRERCACYMALAALGENILPETRELLANGEVEDPTAGIYLAAALAFCGDYNGAYDAYIKYVPNVTFDDSDPNAVKAFVKEADGDRQALTRTALIAASLLDMPEAESFARYLISVEPQFDSYGLQLVTYLAHYVPQTKGGASFTYNKNGLTESVKLNRHRPTVLTFTEEQLKNADFAAESGAIYAVSCYVGRITENPAAPSLKVVKRLSGSMTAGEKITVTIQAAPYSIIYDVIPSCGRVAYTPGFCYNTNGQQIVLYTDKEGKATYEFTVSLSGEFVLESAAAVNIGSGEWGMSEPGTIKISDAYNEA